MRLGFGERWRGRESIFGMEREVWIQLFGHMACDPSSLLVYLEIDARGRERRERGRERKR